MTILYVIFALVCGSSLILWLNRYRFACRAEGTLLSLRTQAVSPLGMLDVGATFLIWVVLQLVAMLPTSLLMGLSLDELRDVGSLDAERQLEFGGWVTLSQLVATVIVIFWFRYRHQRVEWLGTRRGLRNDLLIGCVAALMLLPVVMLIQLLVTQLIDYTHPTLDSLVKNFNFKSAMWAWVAAVGVAPVSEEFFFRGVLQGWLQRVYGYSEVSEKWLLGGELELAEPNTAAFVMSPRLKLIQSWAPIVVTSLIFAGVHLGQGPAPIPLFFLSLGLGYLFRQTGSLLPCVMVHLALNTVSMLILTLSLTFPEWFPAEAEPVPAFFLFR